MDIIKDLKRCLTELNKNLPNCKMNGGELKFDFLVNLTERQKKDLKNDSRISPKTFKKVTSSEALAINYFIIYEQLHDELKGHVRLQRKLRMPVKYVPKPGKKKTNPNSNSITRFDISYKYGDEIYFIESKFLEHYYRKPRIIEELLLSANYLPEVTDVDKWIRFAEKGKQYSHFCFFQLCGDLIAIYYHRMQHSDLYAGKKVRLQCISWCMTDKFLSHYKGMKGVKMSYAKLKQLRDTVCNEEDKALKDFNAFIQSIGMKDCVFEVKHYNDPEMLKAIEHSDKFEAFKRQYLLD